jgi:hypothetical protein
MMRKSKPWIAEFLPSGAMRMHAGLLTEVDGPGVYITGLAQKALHVSLGDYVEIRSPLHDTIINRRVRHVQTNCSIKNDFAYMDTDSLRFLGIDELEEILEVRPAAVSMDTP